jgi:hypothetical protein
MFLSGAMPQVSNWLWQPFPRSAISADSSGAVVIRQA